MKKFLVTLQCILIIGLVSTSNLLSQDFDYLPASELKGQLIQKPNYALFYIEQHEQAAWVAYELTASDIQGEWERTDDFREDKSVASGSASLLDYKGSGYDRGHQIPAGDATANLEDMSATFEMSNISPQLPQFNQTTLRLLETKVRDIALKEERIYVVTGPIFNNNLGTIGKNKVTVPGYYYKVIYDMTSPKKMIAFILPHKEGLSKEWGQYFTTVDSVESLTGIDFFPQLLDKIEDNLEGNVSPSLWKLDTNGEEYSSIRSSSYKQKSIQQKKSSQTNTYNSTSTQCKGIAKSTGNRCRNKTKSSSSYCHYHD